MEKTLYLIPVLLVLILVAMEIYSATAKHLRKKQDVRCTDNGIKTSHQEQICPKCRVGKESYERDKHSTACPYILCWKDGECQYYVPFNDDKEET